MNEYIFHCEEFYTICLLFCVCVPMTIYEEEIKWQTGIISKTVKNHIKPH